MSSDEITIDVAAAERGLREERADIERRLGRFTAIPEPGSNIGFGKRIGDGTIEAVDRLNQIGVGSQLEARLERVERALEKLESGDYGSCEKCGGEIGEARLEAMPAARACIDCASKR